MSGIILVRHGQTVTPGLFLGRADPPLSELGREQARQLAEVLEPPASLVSSGLRRAKETAAILAQSWDVEPIADPRFNEIGYGEWDGLSWSEIEKRWPVESVAKARNWWAVPPPGGEDAESLLVRLRAGFSELQALPKPVVVVAHVGVNAVLAELARSGAEEKLDWGRVEVFLQELGTWIEL